MSTDKDRQIQEELRRIQSQQYKKLQQIDVWRDSSCDHIEAQEIEDSKIEIEQNQSCGDIAMLEEQENGEYQEYGEYDQDADYMIDESMNLDQRRVSSEKNSQYAMQDLVKIIDKEVEKVMQCTGFSKEWALIYFETCGWKLDQVHKFIDQKNSNLQMINYQPTKAQIIDHNGTCLICCLQNQIILKNFCGDQYCQNCWKGQLTERMRSFNKDPFPPCLNEECSVRTSLFIAEELSKNDDKFKKLFHRTLCRSYAYGSTSVKVCKGKQKFSCDRCFKINKLFELLECQNCGNMICARCGQEYHVPSQCYDGPNWKKLVQESTNFIQTLNYKICPYCKQAVQRSSGCNSIICKCQKVFCYICEQKWLPNHTNHGVCYRQKQIHAFEQQKKKKANNQQEYLDKLQKCKAQIENYLMKIKIVQQLMLQSQRDTLVNSFQILSNQLDYIEPLKKKLSIALLVAKNYALSLYFKQSEVMQVDLCALKQPIQNAFDFLTKDLPNLIEAFGEKNKSLVNKASTQMRKSGKSPQNYLAKLKIEMLTCIATFQSYCKVA